MNYLEISRIVTPEILLILIILVLNFLLLFSLKIRTTIITAIILSHITAIILCCIIITDFQVFRALTVAIVVYSITTFILIADSNHFYNISDKINIRNYKSLAAIVAICFLTLIIVLSSFYLVENINNTSLAVRKLQLIRENEVKKNPLIFPGHPVHVNIKKYYLEKNFDNMSNLKRDRDESSKEKELHSEENKQKLRDNPLVKGLSDIVIVIIGIIIAILLSYKNKKPDEI